MNQSLHQLKALADGNRLKMVLALFRYEELCACQMIEWLGITGASVSRHLHQLQQAGLVQSVKDGRWVHFSLSPDFPPSLRMWLQQEQAEPQLQGLAEVMAENPSDLCRKQRTQALS